MLENEEEDASKSSKNLQKISYYSTLLQQTLDIQQSMQKQNNQNAIEELK